VKYGFSQIQSATLSQIVSKMDLENAHCVAQNTENWLPLLIFKATRQIWNEFINMMVLVTDEELRGFFRES
jgi:hypothetical protein